MFLSLLGSDLVKSIGIGIEVLDFGPVLVLTSGPVQVLVLTFGWMRALVLNFGWTRVLVLMLADFQYWY